MGKKGDGQNYDEVRDLDKLQEVRFNSRFSNIIAFQTILRKINKTNIFLKQNYIQYNYNMYLSGFVHALM